MTVKNVLTTTGGNLPDAGAACDEVRELAHRVWMEYAARAGVNLSGFDPDAPLAVRLNFVRQLGLMIGCILSRFSTKLQQSTIAQVEECVRFAAAHGIYIPPEYICVDEAVSGRKLKRDGINRLRVILQAKLVDALLVFKVSRIYRVAYRGLQFMQEDVVDEGVRAISVSEGIDSADERIWKQLLYLHGMMDEMLLRTIADNVRAGLTALAAQGFVTGALPIGYAAVEVPGARPTNQKRPRTIPKVVSETADLIRAHFEWIRDGMPLAEGWRRWMEVDGPRDPRSSLNHISYFSYRHIFSNRRYVGHWEYGRKRNKWYTKDDRNRPVTQPDSEVLVVENEDLRIVSDELFFAVQARLATLNPGPRSYKRRSNIRLCDLVTDCFYCVECQSHFIKTGSKGYAMQCRHLDLCPVKSTIGRDYGVRSVCEALAGLVVQDQDLVVDVIACAAEFDSAGDAGVQARIVEVTRLIKALTRKIEDLTDMAGTGTAADRATLKAKVRNAQSERAALQAERAALERAKDHAEIITPEQVRESLADLGQLLEQAAAGLLGPDLIYRAASVFRQLVGGRVEVHTKRRPARKRLAVEGVFRPDLLTAVKQLLEDSRPIETCSTEPVKVWLRRPAARDALAPRVHQLIDVEGKSLRAAAAILQAEGHIGNSGVVYQIRQRYFEMIGQPAPKLPYNAGEKRRLRA